MKAKLALIGVGASIVLIGVWFFALWKPASNDLDKAKADQVAAESKAQQLEGRLSHLKVLEKNAAQLEADKALLATAIPDGDKLDDFIHQVNERAAKAGVSFVSVSPQQPNTGTAAPGASGPVGGPTAVGLQIQVSGDYFQLLGFLEQLRDGPRLVTVDSFSLSGAGNQMSAAITGRMFIAPTVTVPAATPTTTPAG